MSTNIRLFLCPLLYYISNGDFHSINGINPAETSDTNAVAQLNKIFAVVGKTIVADDMQLILTKEAKLIMATNNITITSSDTNNNSVQKTITGINPDATSAQLVSAAQIEDLSDFLRDNKIIRSVDGSILYAITDARIKTCTETSLDIA